MAYAANVLVATLTDQTSPDARPMLDALRADPRAAKQLLVRISAATSPSFLKSGRHTLLKQYAAELGRIGRYFMVRCCTAIDLPPSAAVASR